MKKRYYSFVLTMLMSMFALCASAYNIAVKNADGKTIYYNFINDNTELIVTYRGTSYYSYSDEYTGNVVIPETVTYEGNTYSVTYIGNEALRGCSKLTSVTIPNSVTSIGGEAFRGCSGLTSITIPNSVTSIGSDAFWNCSGLTSITIPNSVTSIVNNAFGATAWYNNQSNGLVYAGKVAYDYKGTMPANTSITIEDGTLGIASGAFSYCSGLTSITIPNSVTSIGSGAFSYCDGLTSITVQEGNTKYDSRNNCNAIIETATNTLVASCKNSVIPNSVTNIGDEGFINCSSLTSITIPNSVTSIGDYAFAGCSGLTSITIPNSVTSIGSYAFCNCSGLTSITIPNSVTSIGGSAFESTAWYNNQSNGLVYAGKVAYEYKGTMPANTSITIEDGTLGIASYAFDGCSGLTSIAIPNSVTSIGNGAFSGCSGLESVHISDIGAWCKISFGDNPLTYAHHLYINGQEVKDLVVPYGVTSISDNAFNCCSSLTSVTIPNSVTKIESYAFNCCSSLTSVTIPNSVTEIERDAFNGCSGLESVHISDIGAWCKISFGGFPLRYAHHLYLNGQEVKDLIIPNDVTSISDNAFNGCSGLTSVTIPNSVITIGNGAFKDCNNIKKVTLNCKSVDAWFSGLTSISEYVLGSEVEKISASAFNRSRNIKIETLSTTPPSLEGAIKNAVIEAPYGSSVNYAIAENWKETDIIYSVKDGVKYYPLPIIHEGGTIVNVNGHNEGCEAVENDAAEIKLNDIHDMYAVTLRGEYITDVLSKQGKYDFNVSKYHKQNLIHSIYPSSLTIDLQKEGTLIDKIGVENVDKVISLKVSGNINGTDILTIRKMTNLQFLDLNDANIVDGGASYYQNYITSKDAIGEYFFKEKESLIEIKLPKNVSSIKNNAFDGCTNLVAITIPSKVTSVGTDVFKGCNSLVYAEILCADVGSWFQGMTSIRRITLGESVKHIYRSAFEKCSGLESVHISDIGAWCKISFSDNPLKYAHHLYINGQEVKDLVIPYGVTSISYNAFNGCSGLTSVTIPNSVTSIGGSAFSGCSGLTSVTIPNSVTEIGSYAFNGCSGLTSVTIPNSVTEIESSAFNGCSGLESVHISDIGAWCKISFGDNPLKYAHHLYINGQEVKDLVVPYGVTSISDNAFSDCSDLTSVTIPNSVTKIGSYAFSGCSGLTGVTIPNSMTTIGDWAFSGCSGLTSVTLLCNNVGSWFSGNTSIKSVTLGDEVTTISDNAFNGCSGLPSVTIPNSVTSIGSSAFKSCSGLTSVTLSNGVTSIGMRAFENCSGLTSVTIPNSVTTIHDFAFSGCSLTSVTLLCKNVASWFSKTSIKSVTLGDEVTTIGSSAFEYCSGLTSVTIPNSVTKIESYAFQYCSGLESVKIGSRVRYIGSNVFRGSSNLKEVISLNTTPPEIQGNTFNTETYSNATLKVPDGSKTIYWLHPHWENFFNIEEFEANEVYVSTDGYATFYNENNSFILSKGLSAQVLTLTDNGTLSYKTIANGDSNGIIPKGVPVVLVSNNRSCGTYTLTHTTTSTSYTGSNLLHGSSTQTITSNVNGVSTSSNPNYVYYKLAYGKSNGVNANKFGWYWGASDGAAFTIDGGKAWLALPKSIAQSLDAILLIDDATSIDGIEQDTIESSDAQYNMSGQRVSDSYKGIRIINGKKIYK